MNGRERIKMANSIEVFYTGGGITLAEVDLDANRYAVVSSDAPEFLGIYTLDNDGEKTYLPEDMVASPHEKEIAPDLKDLYNKMLEKLKTA